MKFKKTGHRRFPQGYPSGNYFGRSQGFIQPTILQRYVSGARRWTEDFKRLELKPPKL